MLEQESELLLLLLGKLLHAHFNYLYFLFVLKQQELV